MKTGGSRVDTICSLVITAVAVLVGSSYLLDRYRESAPPATVVDGWEDANQRGIRIGPTDAEYTLTQFVDFECPFCRELVPRVDELMDQSGGSVAVVFHHFPLSGHVNALPAAIASECAHRQGRFWPMYRALLDGQDSIGDVPWERYATDAGIDDLTAFSSCMLQPADSFPRIAFGRELAERTGAPGTPTVWLNGRVMNPDLIEVWEIVEASRSDDGDGPGTPLGAVPDRDP